MASNQHHRSQTDKPEPTSDAQERAGRLEHTHDLSPGQRLKSPAKQGIAESERHESIHSILRKAILSKSILRKAVQRHTPCNKGWDSCSQVLASRLHHLSRRQQMSIYFLVQGSSSRGSCLWCHVGSDLTSVPCHGTDFSPKGEKHPQGRTTEPLKIPKQPPEGQSKSKHKSLDSGRGTKKAMGPHTRWSAEEERENCTAQLERGHLPTSLRGSLSPEATQDMTTVHVVGDVTEAKPLMVSVICSIMFHVFIFIFMSSQSTVKPETRLGYESFNFLESQYSVPWSPKSVDSVRQLVLQARNKKQNNLIVFLLARIRYVEYTVYLNILG